MTEYSSWSIQFDQRFLEAELLPSVCGETAPPDVPSAHWRCAGAAAAACRLSLQHSFRLGIRAKQESSWHVLFRPAGDGPGNTALVHSAVSCRRNGMECFIQVRADQAQLDVTRRGSALTQTALFCRRGRGAPPSPDADRESMHALTSLMLARRELLLPEECRPNPGGECSGCGGRGRRWKASVDVDAGEASRAGGALCRYCAFASNGLSLPLDPLSPPPSPPSTSLLLSLSLSREQTTVLVQGCRLIGT